MFSCCSYSLSIYREACCYKLSFQTCSFIFGHLCRWGRWEYARLELLVRLRSNPVVTWSTIALALQPSSMDYVPPGLGSNFLSWNTLPHSSSCSLPGNCFFVFTRSCVVVSPRTPEGNGSFQGDISSTAQHDLSIRSEVPS